MPSAIDPTRPQDGVSASKAELRAALQTIRTEVEHGGFFRHPAPGALESTTAATLGGMWANVKTQFGAVGDLTTNDTTALQNAIDSGWPLWFPPGEYLITQPLMYSSAVIMRGTSATSGPMISRIRGNFPGPILHPHDAYVANNNTMVGTITGGLGPVVMAQDMAFGNWHIDGSCVQVLLANPQPTTHFLRCGFMGFRGLLLTGFGHLVEACQFTAINSDVAPLIASGQDFESIGLIAGQHTTIVECQFNHCGTGMFLYGNQVCVFGARMEVNGYGMRIGGESLTWGEDYFGINWPLDNSRICGVRMESNNRAILIANAGACVTLSDVNHTAEGADPPHTSDGYSDYGCYVSKSGSTLKLNNVNMAGHYKRSPWIINARVGIDTLMASNKQSNLPTFGGTSTIFSEQTSSVFYRAIDMPLNKDVNVAPATPTVTAFHDLNLGGIKGLNIRDPNVLPKNLGGIVAVTEAATTSAVVFPVGVEAGWAAFNDIPAAVNDATSALAPGTYFYATTLIGARGETGVSLSATGSNWYRQVTVGTNQRVDMSFLGGIPGGANFKRRIYRGPVLGTFECFFEIPTSTSSFSDKGTSINPFTGRDMPPPDTFSVPSLVEVDANYAVVVTPSWLTTARVTSKATTGFTIDFGTAAPAGATVQWLLFRP